MIIEFNTKYNKTIISLSNYNINNYASLSIWNQVCDYVRHPVAFCIRSVKDYTRNDLKNSIYKRKKSFWQKIFKE